MLHIDSKLMTYIGLCSFNTTTTTNNNNTLSYVVTSRYCPGILVCEAKFYSLMPGDPPPQLRELQKRLGLVQVKAAKKIGSEVADRRNWLDVSAANADRTRRDLMLST